MPIFALVETKSEVASAQKALSKTVAANFTRREVKNIGYPGGTQYDATVLTDGEYWFWTEPHDNKKNPRHLNWFGVFTSGSSLNISVEINTPFQGINNSINGFFAKDVETGKMYLCHTGGVRGGTKGVNKNAFLAWSNEKPVQVTDSKGELRDGILVMPLSESNATKSAVRYTKVIASFKEAVRNNEIASPQFIQKLNLLSDFYSEGHGKRTGKRSDVIDYTSRHGEVVDALQAWRSKSQTSKHKIVKNVLIDMGVELNGTLAELYEVKTSASRSNIYAAVGQLFIHGIASSAKLVIVLPANESVAESIKKALSALNIEVITFHVTSNGDIAI